MLALDPRGLSLLVDDGDAAIAAPVPVPDDELPIRLAVSVWLDTFDARAPFEAALAPFGVRRAGYLVTESLCEDYGTTPDWPEPRDWADGVRSPGITVLTIFDKKPGLSDDIFYGHWYGHQTPDVGRDAAACPLRAQCGGQRSDARARHRCGRSSTKDGRRRLISPTRTCSSARRTTKRSVRTSASCSTA